MTRLHPSRGRCSDCGRSGDTYRIGRMSGGSYNRRPRMYRSRVCGGCAVALLRRAPVHAGARTSGYDVRSLDVVVSSLGTLEAAEVFTAWRDRRESRRHIAETVGI